MSQSGAHTTDLREVQSAGFRTAVCSTHEAAASSSAVFAKICEMSEVSVASGACISRSRRWRKQLSAVAENAVWDGLRHAFMAATNNKLHVARMHWRNTETVLASYYSQYREGDCKPVSHLQSCGWRNTRHKQQGTAVSVFSTRWRWPTCTLRFHRTVSARWHDWEGHSCHCWGRDLSSRAGL